MVSSDFSYQRREEDDERMFQKRRSDTHYPDTSSYRLERATKEKGWRCPKCGMWLLLSMKQDVHDFLCHTEYDL